MRLENFHKDELFHFYSSLDIIRVIKRVTGSVSRLGEIRYWVCKHERKRPLGRPKSGWEDSNK
jgi:hypothetical protein